MPEVGNNLNMDYCNTKNRVMIASFKDNMAVLKYDVILFLILFALFSMVPLLDSIILQVIDFVNDLFTNLQLQFRYFILSNT